MIPNGIFTLSNGRKHITFKIFTNEDNKRYISIFIGKNNNDKKDYIVIGEVLDNSTIDLFEKDNIIINDSVKILFDIFNGKKEEYAAENILLQESRACIICNRRLTNPGSNDGLTGKECAWKVTRVYNNVYSGVIGFESSNNVSKKFEGMSI